jgi:hypothetical protein
MIDSNSLSFFIILDNGSYWFPIAPWPSRTEVFSHAQTVVLCGNCNQMSLGSCGNLWDMGKSVGKIYGKMGRSLGICGKSGLHMGKSVADLKPMLRWSGTICWSWIQLSVVLGEKEQRPKFWDSMIIALFAFSFHYDNDDNASLYDISSSNLKCHQNRRGCTWQLEIQWIYERTMGGNMRESSIIRRTWCLPTWIRLAQTPFTLKITSQNPCIPEPRKKMVHNYIFLLLGPPHAAGIVAAKIRNVWW